MASVFENNKIWECIWFISEAWDVVPIKQVRGF